MPPRDFERVVRIANRVGVTPQLARVHHSLGLALEALDRDAEAIEQYEIVLGFAPGNTAAVSRLAALGRTAPPSGT